MIEQLILKATKYENKNRKKIINELAVGENILILSASQIGKDTLQLVLAEEHIDELPEQKKIEDNTIGTMLHIALENIIIRNNLYKDKKVLPEENMQMNIQDKYWLTGTADLIIIKDDVLEIHDYKFVKKYSKKSWEKEKHIHQYTQQINALSILAKEKFKWKKKIVGYLHWFYKDAVKYKHEQFYEKSDVPIHPYEVTINNILQKFIHVDDVLNIRAPKVVCEDRWPRRTKTGTIPLKCNFYCNVKQWCKFYNNSPIKQVEKIGGGWE